MLLVLKDMTTILNFLATPFDIEELGGEADGTRATKAEASILTAWKRQSNKVDQTVLPIEMWKKIDQSYVKHVDNLMDGFGVQDEKAVTQYNKGYDAYSEKVALVFEQTSRLSQEKDQFGTDVANIRQNLAIKWRHIQRGLLRHDCFDLDMPLPLLTPSFVMRLNEMMAKVEQGLDVVSV